MSITVSNCDQICHSPTNNSKSKMLYTFSKQNRFPKRRIIMCDKFYDLRGIHTSRAPAFGFGNKYDFTKDVPKSPPPNSYNLKSEFENGASKKGFGLGYSRNQMEVTGPFAQTIRDKNPGPGTYDIKTTIQDVIKYSLGARNYQEDHQKIKIPGPGSYPIQMAINSRGNYFLSKYKNSCVRSFNGSPERGKIQINNIPGPGAYPTDKTDFSLEGKYFLSKIPSSPVRSFGKSRRVSLGKRTDTPGPGNYKLPSQFGHYLSKFAQKKPKSQQTARKQTVDKNQKQNIKP